MGQAKREREKLMEQQIVEKAFKEYVKEQIEDTLFNKLVKAGVICEEKEN